METNDRAKALIDAIRARGSNARDLRDAAHEAYHAIDAGLSSGWDREVIHRALCRKHRRPIDLLMSEVMARAVEQIVCADLGVDPGGDVDRWAMVSAMEAIKFRLPHAEPSVFARYVRKAMEDGTARAAADRVLALLSKEPPPARAKRVRRSSARRVTA